MSQTKNGQSTSPDERKSLRNMQMALLEALRHREQDVFRYIGIIVPALGGFIWLLMNGQDDPLVFATGIVSVILLLLLGALYTLTLGYNYRYLTLQLAKIETRLAIRKHVLESWPRTARGVARRYRLGILPWCTPPDMIKVFWWAFVVGIAFVTGTIQVSYLHIIKAPEVVVPIGWTCFAAALIAPIWFGTKIQNACKKEPEAW